MKKDGFTVNNYFIFIVYYRKSAKLKYNEAKKKLSIAIDHDLVLSVAGHHLLQKDYHRGLKDAL